MCFEFKLTVDPKMTPDRTDQWTAGGGLGSCRFCGKHLWMFSTLVRRVNLCYGKANCVEPTLPQAFPLKARTVYATWTGLATPGQGGGEGCPGQEARGGPVNLSCLTKRVLLEVPYCKLSASGGTTCGLWARSSCVCCVLVLLQPWQTFRPASA